jgi:hypothetical protein
LGVGPATVLLKGFEDLAVVLIEVGQLVHREVVLA